jgi:hypothetical protein
MVMDKVDVCSLGINEKLAKKYNAIISFLKDDTSYEDGMIVDSIGEVEYVREPNKNRWFTTNDYIKITTTHFNKTLWINNPKALKIDRKYNSIVKVENLEL